MGRETWVACGFGVLTGALFLIKINVGVFVGAALVIGMLAFTRSGLLQRLALLAALVGAVLLPVALMKGRLDAGWVQAYCTICVVSNLLLALTVGRNRREDLFGLGDIVAFATCFALTVTAIPLATVAHGTSWDGLYEGLIGQHLGRTHFFAARIGAPQMLWCLAVALLFMAYHTGWGARESWCRFFSWFKAGLGLLLLIASTYDASVMMWYGTPLLWLLAVDVRQGRIDFPRLILAAVTILQIPYAYPVAAAQVDKATLFMVVAGIVCLSDAWADIRETTMRPNSMLTVALATPILLVWAFCLREPLQDYRGFMPLEVPGARRLRLTEDRVAVYRWLVHNLNRHADAFATLPGISSLHYWTQQPSPTPFNHGHWMTLDEKKQLAHLEKLSSFPRSCVIRNQRMVKNWLTPDDPPMTPACRYVKQRYACAGIVAGFELLVQRGRNIDELVYSARLVPSEETSTDETQRRRDVQVTLPRLNSGPIRRLSVCDLGTGEVFIDRPLAVDTREPRTLRFAADDALAIERAIFPVVRLYDESDRLCESIPFLGGR